MKRSLEMRTHGHVIELFREGSSKPNTVLDFDELGFTSQVTKALVRGHAALEGGHTLETQRLAWRHLRLFASALSEHPHPIGRLPRSSLADLDRALEQTNFTEKKRASVHNTVSRMLRWCLRNFPKVIDPDTVVVATKYSKYVDLPVSKDAPSEDVLKQFLAACYLEIEAVESRVEHYRALCLKPEASTDADLLLSILQIGRGQFATVSQMLKTPGGPALVLRIRASGGYRALASKFNVTPCDVFPFYLAILIQTSGNPQAIMNLERACIKPHPLRTDLERIHWDKGRASRQQVVDFPVSKSWAAPNLARRLMTLNQDLVSSAPVVYQRAVFLCRSNLGFITRPSWQQLHNEFVAFRQRNQLPKFDLKLFRKAGARMHHRAGRAVVAAQQRLNHVSVATTLRYTPLADRREEHDLTIHRFQGEMMKEAASSTEAVTERSNPSKAARPTHTVFGFECADPLAGIAPGSSRGQVCVQFQRCATCPGALIQVDDPHVVARILSARDALIDAERRAWREGWAARFVSVYEPTLQILRNEILPAISEPVLRMAERVASIPIPVLE